MRFLIVFAVVCSLAFVQVHCGAVERLAYDAVVVILTDDESVTVAACTTKCVAVVVSAAPREKTNADRACADECRSQLMGPEDPQTSVKKASCLSCS